MEVAILDPFRGFKNAIDVQLADATAVLDAFPVVKLDPQADDDVRRRVQLTHVEGLSPGRRRTDRQARSAVAAHGRVCVVHDGGDQPPAAVFRVLLGG